MPRPSSWVSNSHKGRGKPPEFSRVGGRTPTNEALHQRGSHSRKAALLPRMSRPNGGESMKTIDRRRRSGKGVDVRPTLQDAANSHPAAIAHAGSTQLPACHWPRRGRAPSPRGASVTARFCLRGSRALTHASVRELLTRTGAPVAWGRPGAVALVV